PDPGLGGGRNVRRIPKDFRHGHDGNTGTRGDVFQSDHISLARLLVRIGYGSVLAWTGAGSRQQICQRFDPLQFNFLRRVSKNELLAGCSNRIWCWLRRIVTTSPAANSVWTWPSAVKTV